MGLLSALAVAGGALAGFLGQVADTGVQVFHMIVDILRSMFTWTQVGIREIIDFEKSQPITFTILVGTLLIIFVLTPFVLGFTWNHVIFGRLETHQEQVGTAPTVLSNLSSQDYLNALNKTKLVKADPSLTVKPYYISKKARAFMGTKSLAYKIFPLTTTALTQVLEKDMLYATSMEEASMKFHEKRQELCGELVRESRGGTIPNTIIWEAYLEPIDHDLVEKMRLSAENPSLRQFNVSVTCFDMRVDPATSQDIPGNTWQDKVGNMTVLELNGSICRDVPMEYLSPVITGQPEQIPGSGVPIFGNLLRLWGYLLQGLQGLQYETNITGQKTDCYLMYHEDTRERIYLDKPSWIEDGESANFTAYIFYGGITIHPLLPQIPKEQLQVMKVINLPVTTEYTPGVASILTMPYSLLNESAYRATGGATNPYFVMFSDLILFVVVALAGLIGVLMVVNLQHLGRK
jgi:hypothetical protein